MLSTIRITTPREFLAQHDEVSEMRNFESLGWYEVHGKLAASVKMDRDTPRENLFASLSSDGVSIDGVPYALTGVESFALVTIRAGTIIGLVVEPR